MNLKKQVEETLERRFIYFLGSRPKIRFDTEHGPRYEFFRGRLIVNLLIGKTRKKMSVRVKLVDWGSSKPHVVVDSKFLTIFNDAGGSSTFSVHDFLQMAGCSLGCTHVHYVGITKNPNTRPLDRKHRGVCDMLYKVSNENNEFFLFVNLFKVMCLADSDFGVSFLTHNAMLDEIPVDAEGEVIERSFIAYFDSPIQNEERSHERSALEKEMRRIRSDRNIEYVILDFETEGHNGYFKMYSNSIGAADRHIFACSATDNGLVIQRMGAAFDVQQHINSAHFPPLESSGAATQIADTYLRSLDKGRPPACRFPGRPAIRRDTAHSRAG